MKMLGGKMMGRGILWLEPQRRSAKGSRRTMDQLKREWKENSERGFL
jgi:hypothetical protein